MSKRSFPAVTVAVALALGACAAPPATKSSARGELSTTPQSASHDGEADVRTSLPVGTVLRVRLYQAIDTRRVRHGDSFIASLSTPVTLDDKMVLPKGTVVRGSIQQVSSSGRKGRAFVTLTLDRMEWNGAELPIETNDVTWNSDDHKERNLAWIGGAGVAGAALTGKEQLRIPAESILTFRLGQPVMI